MKAAPVESSPLLAHRGKLIFVAALFFLPLIYFYPAVIGKVALAPGDVWISNLGVRVLLGRMLAAGQLPLWNPYIFGGMPLLANVYTGALYPPNWIFAVFSPAVALNALMISTCHLALVGMYLYARRIGLERLSALVAGIVFTFSGFSIAHLDHIHRLTAVVWLPWIMLAIEELYQKASWRWIVLGAVFIALQLFAGDPQMTLYTAMVGGAYALFCLLARAEREKRRRFILAGAVMSVAGLLLSLAQLLPEAELLRQGERARLSYDYFAGYSLPPRQVVSLVFPYFFGGAALKPYRVEYWGEWNELVPCGYVGLLGLMLVLAAWFGRSRSDELPACRVSIDNDPGEKGGPSSADSNKLAARRGSTLMIWFWSGVALVALALAFGDYLPFGLNHLLYRVPVYNLFRGSYRHWFEFTFAAALLAGFGLGRLGELRPNKVPEVLAASTATVFLLLVTVAALYHFGGDVFAGSAPRPALAGSLANPEAFIPVITFVFAAAAFWLHGLRQNAGSTVVLVVVLMLDLGTFGWFFAWRAVPNRVNERLSDTAAVKFIKSREPDLASFRVISQSALPYDYGYDPKHSPDNHDLLNVSNSLIPRGLQSVSGYDLFHPSRVARVAGDQDPHGIVRDLQAFGNSAQGLNLLNVKYLLLERRRKLDSMNAVSFDGVSFARTPLHLIFTPGATVEMDLGGVTANELAVISLMSGAGQIPDGTPVLRVRLHARDGRVTDLELKAGRDTAEWAYDRADVRATIKHQKPRAVESTPVKGAGYEAHRYLARLPFERAEIERIGLEYLRPDATLQIVRATLWDSVTKTACPIDDLQLPPERWRRLNQFGEIEVWENLKLRPRAWFVPRVQVTPGDEVLRIIKEGKFGDGKPFDPVAVAFIDTEEADRWRKDQTPAPEAGGVPADAQVGVTSYQPQRIELKSRNSQPGFLVLSEVYDRGWRAKIDGHETPVFRTDYTLRGVAVPPGEHRIEVTYCPRSFRLGATGSGIGTLLLIAGSWIWRRLMT